MSTALSVSTSRVDGFEGFREAVHGSHVDVMQLDRGHLRGRLTHISAEHGSLSLGTFSVGIRTQRTSAEQQLIIGMLLGAENRVTHWSYAMHPGDVLVIPPAIEHDGCFFGASSYAALRLDPADLARVFGGEPRMSDAATWQNKNHYRAPLEIGGVASVRLRQIAGCITGPGVNLSEGAAEYWWRAVVEAMTATVQIALPPDFGGPRLSALRLVREVEAYVDECGVRPVHISEICTHFAISRRTLHRCFDEALAIGPVTFLRQKRLGHAHAMLRECDPSTTTVAQVALQNGFAEFGRFSQYYKAQFEEHPSQTLRARVRRLPATASRIALPEADRDRALCATPPATGKTSPAGPPDVRLARPR